MTDCQLFANQIPPPYLDPIRVGEVMGPDAFSEGDWVLLRFWENKPQKVTSVQQNLIFVEQGDGEDFVDTLIHFYPEELGYPLDHRFWSSHQQQCYLRCHLDPKLHSYWAPTSSTSVGQSQAQKLWLTGIFMGLVALVSKLLEYISKYYSLSILVQIYY